MLDRTLRLQRQFGSMIRQERVTRDLTQQALAKRAHLSETYVGEVERGERMVSLDTIERFAVALKLSAAELLAKAGL